MPARLGWSDGTLPSDAMFTLRFEELSCPEAGLRSPKSSHSMQYSDYKCFRFRFDSGIAFISINHPPMNLLDDVLSQEFDKLGRELEADERVRVVVLQSALPDFFIAHSGLGRVGAASKVVSVTRSFRLTQTIGERLRNMPKVTIAKVEGRARGGGSEIALAMDMCFAAVGKAIFGHPEVAVGLVPGGGGTQRLPRLIGRARALEVLLGCNDLSAELAERYGYINRALPENELTEFVEKLARRIASFPRMPSHTRRPPWMLEPLVPWQRGFSLKLMSPT